MVGRINATETIKIHSKQYPPKVLFTNQQETIQKYPKISWRIIQEIRSTTPSTTSHIIINNKKFTTPTEKEQALREHWREIFRTAEEEDQHYDTENEEEIVKDYLAAYEDQLMPHPAPEITRLVGTEHRCKNIT